MDTEKKCRTLFRDLNFHCIMDPRIKVILILILMHTVKCDMLTEPKLGYRVSGLGESA